MTNPKGRNPRSDPLRRRDSAARRSPKPEIRNRRALDAVFFGFRNSELFRFFGPRISDFIYAFSPR